MAIAPTLLIQASGLDPIERGQIRIQQIPLPAQYENVGRADGSGWRWHAVSLSTRAPAARR